VDSRNRRRFLATLGLLSAGWSAAAAAARAALDSGPAAHDIGTAAPGTAQPLPVATPASVGLSSAGLQRMGEFFANQAAGRSTPGYVLMVARAGQLAFARAIGNRELGTEQPMTLDTRFRIASMTKPVTAVAVLMLYEAGKLHLDDPVARFLPEFTHSRVFTGLDAQGEFTTVPALRGIIIRDLLTHRSGLGYGSDAQTPLGKAYQALRFNPFGTLAEKVRLIAGLPLYAQPGEAWRYSYAYDVLGRVVEVVSGRPFPQCLNERLFLPLKMLATGFPARRVPSGGDGLLSTAGDYLRFAQMLANGGSLEGRRYLTAGTVAAMTRNQVADDALFRSWGKYFEGFGYGLGVGVEIDPTHAPHAAFAGDFYWGGIFNTHWVASPATGIVAVLMNQADPSDYALRQRTEADFQNLLFAALTSGR